MFVAAAELEEAISHLNIIMFNKLFLSFDLIMILSAPFSGRS